MGYLKKPLRGLGFGVLSCFFCVCVFLVMLRGWGLDVLSCFWCFFGDNLENAS